MQSIRFAVLMVALALVAATPASAHSAWRIKQDHWTDADEQGFGNFVAAIGNTDCSSAQSCLRNAANPYRGTDQDFKDIDSDCAKWPYLLRAYYAWKNNLPFSYIDGVSGAGGDERFTASANRVTSRHDVVDRGAGIDGPRAIREMMPIVFSGTYRTDVAATKGVLSDFYSP